MEVPPLIKIAVEDQGDPPELDIVTPETFPCRTLTTLVLFPSRICYDLTSCTSSPKDFSLRFIQKEVIQTSPRAHA